MGQDKIEDFSKSYNELRDKIITRIKEGYSLIVGDLDYDDGDILVNDIAPAGIEIHDLVNSKWNVKLFNDTRMIIGMYEEPDDYRLADSVYLDTDMKCDYDDDCVPPYILLELLRYIESCEYYQRNKIDKRIKDIIS